MRTLSVRVATPARLAAFTLAVAVVSGSSGCGYNEVIDRDEDVKAAWAEVENQYKRRADLVPSLVKVVKGAADFEQKTLQQVIEARANATRITIDASAIDDPEKLRQIEATQAQLGSALSRLLAVAENYPNLKASDAFRDLQAQLEGTENRVTVARKRFIDAVAAYNKVVLRFPTSIGASMRGKTERPTFTGAAEDANPPEIDL
jgi:LemA protein